MHMKPSYARIVLVCARHPLWSVLALLSVLLALAGCDSTTVPPAAQDHAPTVKVVPSWADDTAPQNPPPSSTTSTLTLALGGKLGITVNAFNPGGVKQLSLVVYQGGQRIFQVQTAQTPDVNNQVSDTLIIAGTDGAGHTGGQPIQFTITDHPVVVVATASNFNRMSTSISVIYRSSFGPPAGQITEFGPPHRQITDFGLTFTPGGITAGPDGNLWFTEGDGNRIGRITPAGQITEFGPLPTPNSTPESITAGPDGNLWFTETNGNRIGRITPV